MTVKLIERGATETVESFEKRNNDFLNERAAAGDFVGSAVFISNNNTITAVYTYATAAEVRRAAMAGQNGMRVG